MFFSPDFRYVMRFHGCFSRFLNCTMVPNHATHHIFKPFKLYSNHKFFEACSGETSILFTANEGRCCVGYFQTWWKSCEFDWAIYAHKKKLLKISLFSLIIIVEISEFCRADSRWTSISLPLSRWQPHLMHPMLITLFLSICRFLHSEILFLLPVKILQQYWIYLFPYIFLELQEHFRSFCMLK